MILFVEWFIRKEHLSDESVVLRFHLEMNVRRSHSNNRRRIWTRLYRLKAISPFGVRGLDTKALKVRIQWCSILIALMRIAPVSVRLPNGNFGSAYRFAFQIRNSASQINNFSR